tara:strand:+ start:312 stop:848 length:537 start_codon:yes stop_codon:yes gene_type:complete
MALKDRITTGSGMVSSVFGGPAAENVYQGLSGVAKKQYGIAADELSRAKQAAETRATQQFARKRTHGGSAHAQSLSDIATKDISDRQAAANTAIAGMREGRRNFESLAPELYKLAAAGRIGSPSGGLSAGSVSGRPYKSAFAGGYTPGASAGRKYVLESGTPELAGRNFRYSPRKYIL